MADPYAPPGSSPARQSPPGPGGDRRPEAPWSSGSSPLPRPRPPAPDPAAALKTARLVGRFTLLVAAGLLASRLQLPWRAGALVFFLAAVVVGVMTLVAAVRAAARPGALVAIGLGLAATVLVLLVEVASLALWGATSDYQRCRAEALTETARQACLAQQSENVRDLLQRSG